jgi:flagellar basal-body rod protein FlgB
MMEIPRLDDLKHLLDATALQHHLVSHNIANTNTPGFQRKEVNFNAIVAQLDKDSLARTDSLPSAIRVDPHAAPRRDGNTVDPDREIAELTKNTMRYETLLQMAAHQLQQLQIAIGHS